VELARAAGKPAGAAEGLEWPAAPTGYDRVHEGPGRPLLSLSRGRRGPAPQLLRFGYAVMGQEDLDGAVRVFLLNVELFPESGNVFDSLAEAT